MPQLQLPSEIWSEVFRWVTTPDGSCNPSTPTYVPFQPTPISDTSDSTTRVKSALSLVCRQWKHLSTEFLYQDLKLPQGALHALKNVFDQGADVGIWVRRVVLPYSSTVTKSCNAVLPSVEILRSCANLETLVRPRWAVSEDLDFSFDAEHLSFLSLRRLDWWLHDGAERTGGINSLGSVLLNAPNLQYLSVGGVVGCSRIRMNPESEPLCLRKLQTLRLHTGNDLFLRQVRSWALPALIRVVLDSPMIGRGLDGIWEAFGSQIQLAEFGRHVQFMLNDVITPCILACPNLTEVNYHLFFTAPPEIRNPHESIATVGLHAAVNMLLRDEGELCSHLEQHFEILKSSLPALRNVVLYGEWRVIISHPRLAYAWQGLFDRGIVVRWNGCVSTSPFTS